MKRTRHSPEQVIRKLREADRLRVIIHATALPLRFDGYMDGTSSTPQTPEEREIPLSRDETFPPIRSSGKACWWKLIQRI